MESRGSRSAYFSSSSLCVTQPMPSSQITLSSVSTGTFTCATLRHARGKSSFCCCCTAFSPLCPPTAAPASVFRRIHASLSDVVRFQTGGEVVVQFTRGPNRTGWLTLQIVVLGELAHRFREPGRSIYPVNGEAVRPPVAFIAVGGFVFAVF